MRIFTTLNHRAPAMFYSVLVSAIIALFFINATAKTASCGTRQSPSDGLSYQEEQAIIAVARLYALDRSDAILLLAIRQHEAGRPGKEFGVEKACAKQWQDGRKSLLIQACYAAETIKLRYPRKGTTAQRLRLFNHGYPGYLGWAEDRLWWVYILRNMKKYKDIAY